MRGLTLRKDGSYFSPDDPGEWGPESSPRVSITDTEGDLLAYLARGQKVLEIGTGLGVSTRYLARNQSVVVTVDPSEWVRESVWPHLPDNVVTCADRALLAPGFDMAFIDGDHHREAFEEDVRLCERVVRKGGLLVAHDAILLGLSDPWSVVHTTHGLGLRFV